MAAGQQNPREQIEDVLALTKRTLRYWWVVGGITVLGTVAAVAFAVTRPRVYQASTTIMHRDIIPSNLLHGNEGFSRARYMKARFSEMLYARPLLEKVITESGAFDKLVAKQNMSFAVDRLRSRIDFRSKGGGTFRISYLGPTPKQAQEITGLLAKHLIEWELRLQLESVSITKKFLENEAKRLTSELQQAEREFARFLAEHPEFADEVLVATGAAGASIRKRNPTGTGTTPATKDQPMKGRRRLFALERQRMRLYARLNRPTNAKPITRPSKKKSEAERTAELQVVRAKRELAREKRRLENLRLKYTDLHPDVQAAQRRISKATSILAAAEKRLVQARENRPKTVVVVKAVSEAEKKQLRAQIARLDQAIVAERKRLAKRDSGDKTDDPEPDDSDTSDVVALETRWSHLFRRVKDMRARTATIESKAFTADIMASSEVARQGVQLTVVNPAQLPTHPAGMGRKMIVMAGFFVSGLLGLGIAITLVFMDDRIFSRRDIERLEIAPVLTVVPSHKHRGRRG